MRGRIDLGSLEPSLTREKLVTATKRKMELEPYGIIAGSFSLERERVQLAKVEIVPVVGLDGCTKRCLRRRYQKYNT